MHRPKAKKIFKLIFLNLRVNEAIINIKASVYQHD
jgi:hypothetical protein